MLAVLLPLLAMTQQTGQGSSPASSPYTAQQDHQAMMDLLKITALRPGKNGMNAKDPNYANYDESKANPYPDLPPVLVLKSGKPVTSARMWNQRRREIVEDFDREIYGRVPRHTPKVSWEIASTTSEKNGEFNVITKKL